MGRPRPPQKAFVSFLRPPRHWGKCTWLATPTPLCEKESSQLQGQLSCTSFSGRSRFLFNPSPWWACGRSSGSGVPNGQPGGNQTRAMKDRPTPLLYLLVDVDSKYHMVQVLESSQVFLKGRRERACNLVSVTLLQASTQTIMPLPSRTCSPS